MKPVVILDTNALYGRKPLTQADSKMLLALSAHGRIQLVIPEVVLLELSRQWAERVREASDAVRIGMKKLNGALLDVDGERVVLDLPERDRAVFYDYAERLLRSKHAEVLPPPEVSVRELLTKEIEVRKPFARQGTGFRDALIWETVRAVCAGLEDPRTPVVFVTNNYKDFCVGKGGVLHADLRSDLAEGQVLDIVSSLHCLLGHEAVAPLVAPFRVSEEVLTAVRLEALVGNALSALQWADVDKVPSLYLGDGMYAAPITTWLAGASFEEIEPESGTIVSELFNTGDDLMIRVTVDADCRFEGHIERSDYFFHGDYAGYALLEDWNDHYTRASVRRRLRFTFSAAMTEDARDDVVLSLDGAEML